MSGRTYQDAHAGAICAENGCQRLAVDEVNDPLGTLPMCAIHMPRAMTPEEAEVIEAAKAWRHLSRSEDGEATERLAHAVDALPKPAPSLVERIRKLTLKFGDAWADERAVMNEAADELERRGAANPRRGVDFPCEGCGAKGGSTLSNGWYRCNECGYPGQ